MNLHDLSIPQMTRTLVQARAWLDKAEAYAATKKFDPQVLLVARLAPDQWHLARQIQALVTWPVRLVAVLLGRELPSPVDLEPTLPALRAALDAAIEQLRAQRSEDFRGAEHRVIPLSFLPGKALQAPEFVLQLALPNFYFHATTAYSILRHNGVDLGKLDFLGPLALRDL